MRSIRSLSSTDLPRWARRLLGLDPVPPPPHVFALDARELRYGAFHPGPQGLVFAAARSREIPAGTFVDGPLGAPAQDPGALAAAVASLVAELPPPLKAASLILPDAWLRLTFVELEELPKKARDRAEVVSWKLKRQVPFRVEDLRVASTLVTPLPGQSEPYRLLIGFALESLLAPIEAAFAAAGVGIGRIVNTSVALAAAVQAAGPSPAGLTGVVAIFADAYTVTVFGGELGGDARGDGAFGDGASGESEPLLYRFKPQPAETPVSALVQAARRDLRLTASYLAESLPGRPLARVFLAAGDDVEESWRELVEQELGAPVTAIGFEHLGLSRLQPSISRLETAPLAGAARLEVAVA